MIGINQDDIGEQARCVINCDGFNQNQQVYTANILDNSENYIAALIINWHDT